VSEFRFSIIVDAHQMTDEEVFDATDALGAAGCSDASIRGHANGLELLFERAGGSLQSAISSAIGDVERAGFHVSRVEIERDSVLQAS